MYQNPVNVRSYAEGIGRAVADRTINRIIEIPCDPYRLKVILPRMDDMALDKEVGNHCEVKGLLYKDYEVIHGGQDTVELLINVTGEKRREEWGDVAHRVSLGNSMLSPPGTAEFEYSKMYRHLAQASLLMSGRHLQHGDKDQNTKNIELFTNCSTSCLSFVSFYLLLNGSGVGRSYDDEMMVVDWRYQPIVQCVIDSVHADSISGGINVMDLRTAKHMYSDSNVTVHTVADSREGWAYALAEIEAMTYQKDKSDDVLLLDFSKVRGRGEPIMGMQGRPASGPAPLMEAIGKMSMLRGTLMEPWKSTMFIDHYLAECVLVGGARRAARMATKTWRDRNVIEFIKIKRAIELAGLKGQEIADYVKEFQPMSFLYSSNNSVMVDEEFWDLVNRDPDTNVSDVPYFRWQHAIDVIDAVTECSYYDGTGEPGLINADKLVTNMEGADYSDGKFAESKRFKLPGICLDLAAELAKIAFNSPMPMIVNPCGEIVLYKVGGYCVIADVVPYHATSIADAVEAFEVATRALIRTNTMDAVYGPEIKRTNRIGVGMTGLHEFAFKFFSFGWKQIVNEAESLEFWLTLSRFKRAVAAESIRYAAELGVNVPHTNTTMKPAGTTSKLFGLSEGAHLPSMREYLRWVQYRSDDPLIEEQRKKGYPVRELKTYSGTTIVGYPTIPAICGLGMGDKLVTAAEATPEEQYEYLRLLEKYWIVGVEEDGVTPLEDTGNQVSYTLKYKPEEVSFEQFKRTLIEGQATVRCCSVMPQTDTSAYEYQPEEGINKAEFEAISAAIIRDINTKEDIGMEHVECEGGACPIDFRSDSEMVA
jgi:hypothetical protein